MCVELRNLGLISQVAFIGWILMLTISTTKALYVLVTPRDNPGMSLGGFITNENPFFKITRLLHLFSRCYLRKGFFFVHSATLNGQVSHSYSDIHCLVGLNTPVLCGDCNGVLSILSWPNKCQRAALMISYQLMI